MKRLPINVVYIPEEMLLRYIQHHGHGHMSKDYEIVIGIWVKRLFTKNNNKPYCLAFELTDELYRIFPNFDGNNFDNVLYVINKLRKEYTLTDFVICEGKTENKPKRGWAFQVKRFRMPAKNYYDSFALYINELSRKTDASETGLIIVPEIDDKEKAVLGLEGNEIAKRLKIPKGSFKKVWLLSITRNRFWMIEVYPHSKQIGEINLGP